MKRSFTGLPVAVIFTMFLMFSVNQVTFSQPPPPPQGNPANQFNSSGNEAAAAPVGEGIWILIALAASYGVRRYMRKSEVDSENQLLAVADEDIGITRNNDQNQG